ncbi:mycothiol synthase [Nocardioides scoriae]|uniref:Mycothiol synthase n=1 Tax=Nocardioides scoriae TaxID=642780 RepID=A0A1H1PNR8_9ACTN|nr:GNAT family N-acetyltransferase [Nocardioides scoriae]SDS12931.1 mycothiol synthase [Nocardioides scoriae]
MTSRPPGSPLGLRLRPMTPADGVVVTDLFTALEAADRTEERYVLADVLEELDNPMTGPEDWVLAEVDGEVVATSRLLPRAPEADSLAVGIDGGVHPDHRRRGIGQVLLGHMVERARAHVAERGSDLRPVVTAAAPSDQPGVPELYAAHGLHPHRWTFVMAADLATPPQDVALPEGYALSTWEDVDHEELRAAHNVAFVGHPGWSPWSQEMWRQWISESRSFRPALSLLLRAPDGGIAAYVQANEYDAVAEQTDRRETYLVKVGTLPDHRRRGLADVLLRRALRLHAAAGCERSGLDVDSENPSGALAVYERVGFSVTRRWTDYLLQDPAHP